MVETLQVDEFAQHRHRNERAASRVRQRAEGPGFDHAIDFLEQVFRRQPVQRGKLLPSHQSVSFELRAGNFYIALAGEPDPARVLKIIAKHIKPEQRIFVGVVAPIDPQLETAEQVRDRILQAAKYIPVEQLGTTDDCGFSPFCDDTSTSRDTAFAKIRSRVLGTALAADMIAGR